MLDATKSTKGVGCSVIVCVIVSVHKVASICTTNSIVIIWSTVPWFSKKVKVGFTTLLLEITTVGSSVLQVCVADKPVVHVLVSVAWTTRGPQILVSISNPATGLVLIVIDSCVVSLHPNWSSKINSIVKVLSFRDWLSKKVNTGL